MNETKATDKDKVLKVALAAFLHDIGKFAQRAEGKQFNAGIAAFYPSNEFLDKQRQRLQPFNPITKTYTHKHAIYTAAFIDHLEKVLPSCFQKSNWGGETWIGDLAAGHHFIKRPDDDECVKEWNNLERWIIATADRMASALDREGFKNFETHYNRHEEIANFKSARVWPIIEAIKHSSQAEKKEESGFRFRIPLKELREDLFFPGKKESILPPNNEEGAKEYQRLFSDFIDELMGLEQFKNNVNLWFEQFENLYMRYAGQIPAATVSPAMQDISLYDHSKITAAIATALYVYHVENNQENVDQVLNDELQKFLFIGAGFNGIQKFIFASGGSTNKAAAKILRGRSFYVSLLSELIGDMLLRETGLPPTSIVFNAAGQVTIIAPNLPRIRDAVARVKEIANRWLIESYYGQTSVSLAMVEVSQKNISIEYRQMWHKLSRAMEQEKFKKFDLTKFGGTQKQFFEKFKPELGVCNYCGQRPALDLFKEDDKGICGICRDQIEIGSKLVKSDAIAIWESNDNSFERSLTEPLFGQFQVFLGKMGEAVNQAKRGKLLKIARLEPAGNEPEWRKLAFKPIKAYVPVYSEEDVLLQEKIAEEFFAGQIKSFESIASAARKELIPGEGKSGIAALGVLKADVDNLGMIFGLGLNEEIQTLTRISVLSRQFNNFFAVYLPSLLREKFKDVYTVFAGGDDLFIIGPWTDILELAPVIHCKFKEFVCNNPDITLSMGISIHKPGEPVKVMAQAAEEALEKAKSADGKDSVCIFGEVVKWKEYPVLQKIAEQIRTWLIRKTLNTAMLYRFNSTIEDIKEAKRLNQLSLKGKPVSFEKLAKSMTWKARLKYSLVRNIGRGEDSIKPGEADAQRAELEETVRWLDEIGSKMKIPLWQEIYRRRRN